MRNSLITECSSGRWIELNWIELTILNKIQFNYYYVKQVRAVRRPLGWAPSCTLQQPHIECSHQASTEHVAIRLRRNMFTKIIQRLHTNYHTLKYATKFLPTEIMIKLYYAHIYPHLIYGISIWGTSEPHRTYIRPLHIIHNKIIRKITKNARNAHTKNILQKHKILTIYNLYIQRVTLEMHKYVYPKQHLNRPEHQHTYTRRSDIHGHYTRLSAQHNYYQPHSATAYYTQKFIGIWNTLPHTLTTEPKYATFKEALKIYLLQKQAQDQPWRKTGERDSPELQPKPLVVSLVCSYCWCSFGWCLWVLLPETLVVLTAVNLPAVESPTQTA
jgi:hypothetical protein